MPPARALYSFREEPMKTNRRGWVLLAAGAAAGALLVSAAAAGMKYSDSRAFCTAFCHGMASAGITQVRSPHADLACNDCHAPHDLVRKIPFKAKEGFRDFVENIRGADVPFRAGLETRDVVNANCISCHGVTTGDVMLSKPYCTDCHRGAAHSKKTPISFREAADD